jgi:hypothetical protein
LAEEDPTRGNVLIGSPLAMAMAGRGAARWMLGVAGWREDFDRAIAIARSVDTTTCVGAISFKYLFPVPNGAIVSNQLTLTETADALRVAEQYGDDFAAASRLRAGFGGSTGRDRQARRRPDRSWIHLARASAPSASGVDGARSWR